MPEDKKQMVIKTISTTTELWDAAKDKAASIGQVPLSAVIRRLLEKWLRGEVSID